MTTYSYICLALLLLTHSAHAAEQIDNEITLDETIVRVLENNPKLVINDYKARAIAERIKTAALRPADKIRVEMENLGGTGDRRYLQGVETTLSFARVLELGNKADYRANVVQQESYVLQDNNDATRLDLVAEAASRFIEVIIDQQRLIFAEQAMALLHKAKASVAKRVDAALSPEAELHRIDIDLARLGLEQEHAEHELEAAKVYLSSLWGMPIPDFTTARADLFQLEEIQPFPAYANLLERNPDLVRLATRQRLASARLQLAQSARKPDIELSGGMRYLAEGDDMAFVLSATIPLGTAERAASSIREKELLGQIDPLEYEQKKLTLHATLFEIYQEIKHSRIAVETLQQRIIPSAQQALSSYEKLYNTGRYSLLELLESQRSLLQSRFQLIEAAARFHRLRIDLERLTGASILTGDRS